MKNLIKRLKFLRIIIFILILFVAIKNFADSIENLNYLKNDSFIIPSEYSQDFQSILYENNNNNRVINVLNLQKPLEPVGLYSNIKCRQSARIYVSTTLCIHNLQNDIHVSGSIWKDAIWESHILEKFLNYLDKNKDWMVLDIGAHIGVYTMYAAKLGRHVVSVEPFYDNVLRIHKAAQIENVTDKITLVSNAISNRRNETKRLTIENENIGGQSLIIYKNEVYQKPKKDKYLVKTIIFDDLIEHLPRKSNGNVYKKALLKIDIEGYEIYAFQNASKFFDLLDIRVVFMEWGNLPKLIDHHSLIENLIDFFTKRNYAPYPVYEPFSNYYLVNYVVDIFRSKKPLPLKYWEYWTWDIMWIKN